MFTIHLSKKLTYPNVKDMGIREKRLSHLSLGYVDGKTAH